MKNLKRHRNFGIAAHIDAGKTTMTERILFYNSQVIKAKVPLSELMGYITDLRTLSSGRASATMVYHNYMIVPKNIADKLSV